MVCPALVGAQPLKIYSLIFAIFMAMVTFQVIQYLKSQDAVEEWMAQGPRFLRSDGQALCERIQQLEKEPQECQYLNHAK